jgi:PTS system nitrogen regulatory IIA component
MNIDDFLASADALVEPRALDKVQLLRELSARAAARLQLDPGAVADAILTRENLGSTGMGSGVAIPHARFRGLKKSYAPLSGHHRRRRASLGKTPREFPHRSR